MDEMLSSCSNEIAIILLQVESPKFHCKAKILKFASFYINKFAGMNTKSQIAIMQYLDKILDKYAINS